MVRARPHTGATLVYRGQLEIERSRIAFILAGLCDVYDTVDVVHLSPGVGSDTEHLKTFTARYAEVRNVEAVQAQSSQVAAGRRHLRRVIEDDARTIIAVGFSVWPYVIGLRCRAWFINGIPEERLLTSTSRRARMIVRASWWGARIVNSDLHVVVSRPMASMVSKRLRTTRVEVIPNAVDLSTYSLAAQAPPTYLTYQGGGSPWQGLDRLAQVWSALHALDPSLRFRIISRDPRADVLASDLPESVVDRASSEDAAGVSRLLSETRLGFLFRAPTVVNVVSWPMKMGEYLASGAPVVVSDCGWDLAPLVIEHGAGLVVKWDAPPETTARSIISYLSTLGNERPAGVQAAASALDADRWERTLHRLLAHDAPGDAHG